MQAEYDLAVAEDAPSGFSRTFALVQRPDSRPMLVKFEAPQEAGEE